MPETGERSPTTASASYIGGGRYAIYPIRFSHPGWWNVALTIDGRAAVDSVAFNLILPPGPAAN